MYFMLFLTFENVRFSVYGPEAPQPYEEYTKIEYYPLKNGWDDVDLFYDDIDDIDFYCGTLLDYGDVDYFDAAKCEKLKEWIEKRLTQDIVPRYQEMLEVLLNLCVKAIELGTGVVIDL